MGVTGFWGRRWGMSFAFATKLAQQLMAEVKGRTSPKPHVVQPPKELEPAFCLAKDQNEKAIAWMRQHDRGKHIPPGKSHRYSGAIGGSYTWMFTPTSLGVVSKVQCACGETLDISDYDSW